MAQWEMLVAQWLAHQTVALRFRVRVLHISSLRLTDISMWVVPGMLLGPRAVCSGGTEEKRQYRS